MKWLDLLKRKPQGKPQFRAIGPPDASVLGDFLFYALLGDKFNIPAAKYDDFLAKLPDELRSMAKFWMLVYLCWIFITCAASKYGSAFAEQIFAQAKKRLRDAASKFEGIDQMDATLDFWFASIDNATKLVGTKIGDQELPFEYFVALSFLSLDSGSPYYQGKPSMPLSFDVAAALGAAKHEALPSIQRVIEFGGPVEQING